MASVARGKALVAKLRANPKVKDPEALAAWLGRVKRLKRGGLSTKAAMKAVDGKGSGSRTSHNGKKDTSKGRFSAEDVKFGKPASYSGQQQIEVKADLGEGFDQTIAKLKRNKGEKEWQIEYGGKTFRQPSEQNLSFIKKKLAQKLADDEKKGELQTGRSRAPRSTANPVKGASRSTGEKLRDPRTISDDELPLVIQFAKNSGNQAFYQKLLAEKRRREKRKK